MYTQQVFLEELIWSCFTQYFSSLLFSAAKTHKGTNNKIKNKQTKNLATSLQTNTCSEKNRLKETMWVHFLKYHCKESLFQWFRVILLEP